MDREIKFRAWDDRLKMWCYDGNAFTLFGEVLMVDGFSSHFIENPIPDMGSLDRIYTDIKVMQFTGLKDKNGKEIYEGDIIQNVSDDGTRLSSFEIRWIEDSCQFVKWKIENVDYGSRYYDLSLSRFYEVIGNIYENPDLIKT